MAATQLVEAARFWAKLTKSDLPGAPCHPERIYNYYCVHLKIVPQPAFVLDISGQWQQKLAAIRCYESQFVVGRSQDSPTFLDRLRDEAAYWGKAIGVHEMAPNLSFLLAPIICEGLLLFISWRNVLVCIGCVSILLGCFFYKFSYIF